jgi:hypothetical protein
LRHQGGEWLTREAPPRQRGSVDGEPLVTCRSSGHRCRLQGHGAARRTGGPRGGGASGKRTAAGVEVTCKGRRQRGTELAPVLRWRLELTNCGTTRGRRGGGFSLLGRQREFVVVDSDGKASNKWS